MFSVIIIDDKPLAIGILEGYLQKVPFAELKATFINPIEAFDYIEQHSPDLVLLDIQMPDLNGMQLMKMAGNRCHYILVTAYSDYAVEGFEHSALDYLLKPVSFDRFYQAMLKARDLFDKPVLTSTASSPIAGKDFVFFKTERRIRKLDCKEILFIEGRQNYVQIQTEQEKIMTLQTMKQTEQMLHPDLFIRIHKSFIVNLSAIQSVDQHQVIMKGHSIPVGEAYRQRFYKRLGV